MKKVVSAKEDKEKEVASSFNSQAESWNWIEDDVGEDDVGVHVAGWRIFRGWAKRSIFKF